MVATSAGKATIVWVVAMFVLAVVEDKIKISPEKFESDTDRVKIPPVVLCCIRNRAVVVMIAAIANCGANCNA